MPRIPRLVVATDLTDASAAALRVAARIRAACDAELLIVHVLPDVEDPDAVETLGMAPGDLLERRAGEAESRLRRLEALLGRGHAHASVRCGSAAIEIARLANQTQADLIVLGGDAPPGMGVVPAVAERVQARARCPVLVALPTHRTATAADGQARTPEHAHSTVPDVRDVADSVAAIAAEARALGDDVIVLAPRRRGPRRDALRQSAA
jgi:nucleotide-binding universal stress UspA family protein